jgi:hypothetical protein
MRALVTGSTGLWERIWFARFSMPGTRCGLCRDPWRKRDKSLVAPELA